MDALITNIRQDAGFYCSKAMKAFEKKNYIESIKQLNKAEKVANGPEKYEIYFIQGLMYNCIEDYARSTEYFLLSVLSLPLQAKAFKSIFENMLNLDRPDIAEAYKVILSYHPAVNKEDLEDVTASFESYQKRHKPKIHEVSLEESENFKKDFAEAQKLFEDEMYSEALVKVAYYDYDNSPKLRDLLARCCMMQGNFEAAEKILIRENMTTGDKLTLLACYFLSCNKAKKIELIEELQKTKLTISEKFKFARELSNICEFMSCLEILEKYLVQKPYDYEANVLYISTCLELSLFTKAKNRLLNMVEISKSNRLIFKELLNLCENKNAQNISSKQFDICYEKKYKAKINSILKLEDKEFENAVVKNEDLIFWLSRRKDRHLRNLFFARAAKIRSLQDVMQKILVDMAVDIKTKLIILNARLDCLYNEDFIMTKNNMILGFNKLNPRFAVNPIYFKAHKLIIQKVLDDNEQGIFEFGYFFSKFFDVYKDSVSSPYIMAAIISWEIDKKLKRNSIKSICKYFEISQEEFWKYYKGED